MTDPCPFVLYEAMRAASHSREASLFAAGYQYAENNGVSWYAGRCAVKKKLTSDGKLLLNVKHEQNLHTIAQRLGR
jgi:hypothetical protein